MEDIKLEVNDWDVIKIKLESNKIIKDYRKSLNLETPNNRVDQGDLKCIFTALNNLGFSITRNK